MAVIKFNGYKVIYFEYTMNASFDKEHEVQIQNAMEFDFIDESVNQTTVVLSLNVGSTEDEKSPFKLSIVMEGYFEYKEDEDHNKIGFKQLQSNCVAILYPYLRAAVSNLTNLANDYPTYILPTLNVHALIFDEE